MINELFPGSPNVDLQSDLAGEYPLYLYWPKNKSKLLYTKSIKELLEDSRVPKPLSISSDAFSFLLQSGVVPPPKTVYEDIYILGIGDKAAVTTSRGEVQINFSHAFPFVNANRLSPEEMEPDEGLILEMLADATKSRLDPSKPSFLFHSGGKDSNSIALALAEAGWQNQVTLISHKSKGAADESEISAEIARKLGFKHQILHEVDQLKAPHQQAIDDYFTNAPFPSTDNVTLAYPLYSVQLPELRGANVIDGGGNDSHMGSPPSKKDLRAYTLAQWTSLFPSIRKRIKSESVLNPLLRTPAEWCGMAGLSLGDSNKIYPNSQSVYPYWLKESKDRQDWDIYDFKSDIYSTRTIAETHIRKARNFTDAVQSNLILPFANPEIAEYFAQLPEMYLFNRKTQKNKIILRTMLNNRIGLDCDALGKMGFNYDSGSMVLKNWNEITREIYSCSLWRTPQLDNVVKRLHTRMDGKNWQARAAARMIYRLYLLSFWRNKNKWIN